jgi:hypothetical protein
MTVIKRLLTLLFCALMIVGATVPVFAVNARMSHAARYDTDFSIDAAGVATVYVNYTGNATTFTDITVETYIQKRSLGLVWTKVDNGESNKTWVDTSTSQTGTFVHNLQLDSTGTYRAVFKITFSGTGASDDVITERIEDVYS